MLHKTTSKKLWSWCTRRWFHRTKMKLSESTETVTRKNEIDIQMLSDGLHKHIFKNTEKRELDEKSRIIIKSHLENHDLWNRPTEHLKDVNCSLPKLQGENIDEHFRNIAIEQTADIVNLSNVIVNARRPPKPTKWQFSKGWTKYESNGEFKSVDFPDADILIFDMEVLVKEGHFPTMATALSPTHWYSWCSDYVVENKFRWSDEPKLSDLIPLETKRNSTITSNKNKKLIIGHNVGFDRSFVKEQYFIQKSKASFLDTMSLHIATCGLTTFQRLLYKAGGKSMRKEVVEHTEKQKQWHSDTRSDWKRVSTMNNLNDVYQLHCDGEPLQKSTREIFVEGSMADVREKFQELMTYCAGDVEATHSVFQQLWPEFLERFPHPVTLAGMLEMGSAYLPINANWERYIQQSNAIYDEMQRELKNLLMNLANETCLFLEDERYKEDPWLWDLDWSVTNYKLKKETSKKSTSPATSTPLLDEDETDDEEEVYRRQVINKVLRTESRIPKNSVFMAGYPKWYRELCKRPSAEDWQPGPSQISTQMRVVPKLLRLTWEGFPLHYDEKHGWGYLIPGREDSEIEAELDRQDPDRDKDKHMFPIESLKAFVSKTKKLDIEKDLGTITPPLLGPDFDSSAMDPSERSKHWKKIKDQTPLNDFLFKSILDKHKGDGPYDVGFPGCMFYKIPHKDGVNKRVGNPLAKDYLPRIEDGTLRAAAGNEAQRVLLIGKMCSYWKNNQQRIEGQMAVWMKKSELPKTVTKQETYDADGRFGAIVPRIVPAGTVTRRAVEQTWLTASNAYVDRIGSELKAMIQAPPGYHFVGADVDSQELWIAAVLGDAFFQKVHGCTALGWMTLQGKKKDKTDLHSKTAETVNISRDHAKVFNYGRIYGAGQKFAEKLLVQFNPKLSPEEAKQKARKMYLSTKGRRSSDRHWYGGSESHMFNELERIAKLEEPRTPVLDCRISKALEPDNVLDDFMTSRVNWVVQSSAVDYLHLMLVCMRWLIDKYNLNARFSISLHDEVRYLVESEDRYKAALALQITNLLTRSMFAYKLGMNDLPQSVAFFSAVDIDVCLRKEVSMDCKTPSNVHGLCKGYGIPHGEALDIHEVLNITGGSFKTNKNVKKQEMYDEHVKLS
ncbi:hypothetical protein SNE40_023149 [Patella caerulea]|uniref:DNA polymerase subunit gamma-1 n=2 Tax=Patella caerulea TaxID=87958 RepID=A0AAN8GG68_PATCE